MMHPLVSASFRRADAHGAGKVDAEHLRENLRPGLLVAAGDAGAIDQDSDPVEAADQRLDGKPWEPSVATQSCSR
jgi:hypothetical protein